MKPQDRTRAILTSQIEPSARFVLVALADFMSDDRLVCWPSTDSIADRTGYCGRQVREILGGLEARGLIRRFNGDHKCRDITIAWEALASAGAPPTARGGRRTPAKTAPPPAIFAPQDTGKDCHPDRQRLPSAPAKTAAATGKDCTQSDHEAGFEATMEATNASAPEAPGPTPTVTPPRRPAKPTPTPTPDGDLVAYLGLGLQAHAIALVRSGITSRAALLRLTDEDLRFTPGIGGTRAQAIAARMAEHGDQLATAPARASPRTSGAPPGESALDRALRRTAPTRTPEPP